MKDGTKTSPSGNLEAALFSPARRAIWHNAFALA
jgi:hypothetical protein